MNQNYDTFRTVANDKGVKEAERLLRQIMNASSFDEADLQRWITKYNAEI